MLEHDLAHVAMFTNADFDGGDKVKLMTIHAAKGLEFRHVFVCGMDEGILPSRKTQTMEAMEEERRLAFVAFTRAQDTLALTCAEGTAHDGMPRYPSRFILDVNPALLDFTTPLSDSLIAEARKFYRYKDRLLHAANEGPAFEIGDTVRHAVFGRGTIVAIDVDEGSYRIAFDGMDTPRTLSIRAKLARA